MQSKQELRKVAKEIRKTLNINEISEKILQLFLLSDIYKNSKNIGAYYPFGTELNITKLFNTNSKNFYLPKIHIDDNMYFHRYIAGENLSRNKYGILEPISEKINPKVMDLIILPALMVDENGYRLGYGKGYYDKFISKNNILVPKIVFIPDELLLKEITHNEYDIPADIIVTQAKILFVNK